MSVGTVVAAIVVAVAVVSVSAAVVVGAAADTIGWQSAMKCRRDCGAS